MLMRWFFLIAQMKQISNSKNLLLEIFGDASGLHTNLHKSNGIPIKCDSDIVELVSGTLQCTIANFHSIYLGLPISDKKPRKCDMMAWIEKIADKLPG